VKKIPPFRLEPRPLSDEAAVLPKFRWASPEMGTRHKLGGEPDFIQGSDWPNCAGCDKRMTFYAQLDSINDDFCIADCGMIYVFICLGCNESKAIVQSY
jgi:hypothetical protein